MFIYQERLEDIEPDAPDEDQTTDAMATARGQQSANQSNLSQGGSLAV